MERNFQIKNQLGLHGPAAAKWVQLGNHFESSLSIRYDGQEMDGKSILDLLTLACPMGSDIMVRAEGSDAEKLLEAMQRLIDDKFGEE